MSKNSLSTDQKINMSLDDIVKSKSVESKKNVAKKQNVAAGTTRRQSKSNVNGVQNNNRQTASNAKAAQSVGAGKAKRNANVNQRRGLNQTGKATKSEVKTAVLKAGQQKRPRPNSAGSSGSLAKLGGLKISFKPKELAKTTEKGVSQQIQAVLAKQPVPRNNTNNTRTAPKPNGNRSVVLAPKGAARGNPKRAGGRGNQQR